VDSLHGRVALVTGGASGIGLAGVHRLAEEGARVVVADVADERGRDAAHAAGGLFVHADVSDPDAWDTLMATATDAMGPVEIAFLNAGVTTGESDIRHLTVEQYRRITGVNIDGVVFGVRAAATTMSASGGGAIVVTASMAGLIGGSFDPVYTLTKHAVIGLVRALGPALAPLGVTVNAVCPGVVDTPLLGDEGRVRLRQLGFELIPPEQIADAALAAIRSGDTGQAWMCRAGMDHERFPFQDPPVFPTPAPSG